MNEKSLKRTAVAGSERSVVRGAKFVGPVDANERVSATVILRRRASQELTRRMETLNATPPTLRQYYTHAEFSASHGADDLDVKVVEEFAREFGITVERTHAPSHTVVLSGTAAAMSQAFAVELRNYQHPDFTYRGHEGAVYIPEHLADVVTAVLGLDNRPQASPHFRISRPLPQSQSQSPSQSQPQPQSQSQSQSQPQPQSQSQPQSQPQSQSERSAIGQVSYTPPEVAQFYAFPTNVDCAGQCIALVELGGGFNASNVRQYFTGLGLPAPTVASVSVDGGRNQPTGNPNGPDGEVDLDIEVAASVATGSRVVAYFAPNTDAGFLNAINAAAHDHVNKPSVISISWGGPESSWTAQAMHAMNTALENASALGITVCCAAGDNGSADGVNDGAFHVDFPASAPYSLACGGTRLTASGTTIVSETVWNDGAQGGATGGGISSVFPVPSWQAQADLPPSANPGAKSGRGVPDVAGNADPATGYQVLVDGQSFAIGGTSAVAPLWAGLVAIANQTLGHSVGFINPVLYSAPVGDNAFHDITTGNNDVYQVGTVYPAGPGWDACTGLGSPHGQGIINVLSRAGGATSG